MSYYEGGWPVYVTVAERRKKAEKAAAKAKKAGAIFSPIAAYRGAVAKTFWGKAWCANLEQYSDFENRLPRGRTYVRNGSVIDLNITAGEVKARVMGSALYSVTVSVAEVKQARWQAIGADCAASIDSLVELLQGKLSKGVMERLCTPDTGLFPSPKELKFSCSCPDYASMCKHVAAVLYGVGARLDTSPDLLFLLRRVNAKDLVKQVTAPRATAPQKKVGISKVLADASLADVFGIEFGDETSEPQIAPKKARARPKRVVEPAAIAADSVTVKPTKPQVKVKAAKPAASKTVAAKKRAVAAGTKSVKRAAKGT